MAMTKAPFSDHFVILNAVNEIVANPCDPRYYFLRQLAAGRHNLYLQTAKPVQPLRRNSLTNKHLNFRISYISRICIINICICL